MLSMRAMLMLLTTALISSRKLVRNRSGRLVGDARDPPRDLDPAHHHASVRHALSVLRFGPRDIDDLHTDLNPARMAAVEIAGHVRPNPAYARPKPFQMFRILKP